MDAFTTEQDVRREAIRRHLQGERPNDICRDLGRSPSWFDKWWAEYRRQPHTDFADHSRAPHTCPGKTPAAVEQAIVAARSVLEAADTPATEYGLIGAPSVQGQLVRLRVQPVPSASTIQRIMARHNQTHPIGAGADLAYYPWPVAWAVNAIHATDIITRNIRGGEEIDNFHTIDLDSHAVCLTQQADKSSATTRTHLLKTWAKLGLPHMAQFDNEAAFCGGHTHPRVIGRVVRLCLFCGIEPIFTPVYDAKRNYQIETFHSLWVTAFWSRKEFTDLAQVRHEAPKFVRWYHTVYQPPALADQTPSQARRGTHARLLTTGLRQLIPLEDLPITAGRIHFMRKVDQAGHITFLNETWPVGERWIGDYVRATIDTAQQTLTVWHQAEVTAKWHLIKTRQFRLEETVHALLPQFKRNSTRCRDYWPG
jgi:putative transposase